MAKKRNKIKHGFMLRANQLSLLGKALAMLLIVIGMILSLLNFEINMDVLKAGAWTLALIGTPIDASHVIANLVSPWNKK